MLPPKREIRERILEAAKTGYKLKAQTVNTWSPELLVRWKKKGGLKWFQEMIRETFPEVRSACIVCGKACLYNGPILYILTDPDNVFSHYCSAKCRANCPQYIKTLGDSLEKKYGARTTFGSKTVQKNIRKTFQERFGADCFIGTKEGIRKRLASTDYKVVQESRRKACLKKYGVEHPMQVRRFHEKQQAAAYRTKTYWIGDNSYQVQGFEPKALDYLVNDLKVSPNRIKTNYEGVPSIKWVDSSGKSHWYHPDMLVEIDGVYWLVEVKGSYTCGIESKNRTLWSVVKAKGQAVEASPYHFVLLVVHKGKVYPFTDIGKLTRTEVKRSIRF